MTTIPRITSRLSVPSSCQPVPLKVWPFTMVWVEPWGFSLAACCQVCCWVPGVRRRNFVKFRSRTGSSVSCFASNDRGHVGPVGLQQLAGRGLDGDGLGHVPELEAEVDLGLGVDVHDHLRDLRALEAGQLGLHLVPPGQQPVLAGSCRRRS